MRQSYYRTITRLRTILGHNTQGYNSFTVFKSQPTVYYFRTLTYTYSRIGVLLMATDEVLVH